MKIVRPLLFLAATGIILLTSDKGYAQAQRPDGVASLAEMSCQSINSNLDRYAPVNGDVVIGKTVLRAIGRMGNSPSSEFYNGIYVNRPVQVSCRLASPNQTPQFKTLSLGFGFGDQRRSMGYANLRLSIYRDGKIYGSKEVVFGSGQRWVVDVQDTRSITLEAECLKGQDPTNSSVVEDACPYLFFFEDVLER